MENKETNNIEWNKLTPSQREKISDGILRLAYAIFITRNQREIGDLVVLEEEGERFEGVVRLLKMEKFHTCLDDSTMNTHHWEDPVAFRVERWLVEWVDSECIDKKKYPSRWFTQAALQGKKGHKTLYTPCYYSTITEVPDEAEDSDNLPKEKQKQDVNRNDRLYRFNGDLIF